MSEETGDAVHIPRNSQMMPVGSKRGGKPDPKPQIERAFADDVFIGTIEKYFTKNPEGSKHYNMLRVIDLFLEWDAVHNGEVGRMKLNAFQLSQPLNVVVRRHWIIDKHGKYVDVNPKRYRLLADEAAEAA
jgi:hypothetical protein